MKSPRHLIFAMVFTLLIPLNAEERPPKLESLTTTKNRTYEKVEIREVTPSGIKIRHDAGTATIPYNELPARLQKQLGGFDPQAAVEHKKKEEAALREQEAAIDREVKNVPEKMPVVPEPARVAGKPVELQGDPFAGGFERPGDSPKASKEVITQAPDKKPTGDKGELSARIVGYRTGVKNVEFKVRTNCQAKLVVHEVVYNGYLDTRTETIDIAPNTNFVREIWVYNNYSAELSNTKDERLDTESQYKKTNVGGLTHATLH